MVRSRLSVFRLGLPAQTGTTPRYFVDHVDTTDGAVWLGRTRAWEIGSVRALSGTEALTRFAGSAAARS